MFTGIIEETGKIEQTSLSGTNLRLRIKASRILSDLKLGDSVNINGVCQTVVEVKDNRFTVEAVEETLRRTNLDQLRPRDSVNLERALRISDRLGGHLVSGHVDFVGRIKSINQKDQSYIFEFESPKEYQSHFVEKGSVAIDGISLTVVQIFKTSFIVSIIPFTMKNTTLGTKKIGDPVNIETDLIGKYVERILTVQKGKFQITEEWLKEKGW
ncbi:MAG: riboflavin synthase [candidate division Zixibacteria bacterium]|nr:riboflavin synthase [candidate division Zixibacteria bacterium]